MLPFVLSLSKLRPEAPLSLSKGVSKGAGKNRFCVDPLHVQKVTKRGIIQPEADHAWFVESAADDTNLIEHLAKRCCASK